MSALDPLAPDQRAVVSLVLQQGRSYEQIAALLGMPAEAVRARAQAGLAALAPDDGLPGEIAGPLADYLLGQQQPGDAEATRGLLSESPRARDWATAVSTRLADATPNGLPPIPAPRRASADLDAPPPRRGTEDSVPAGEAPWHATAEPAPSRLGGALLIAGVLAVVAVVLYLVLGRDDDPGDGSVAASTAPTPTATATPAPTAEAQVADTIALRSPTRGDARGTMTVFLQEGQLLFALEAQDVPPSSAGAAYGVWLTGPGDRARRLGFTNPVGEDGQLAIQGPGANDLERFPRLYATYERVVVSRETTEDARRPGPVILRGKLPSGRAGG